MKYFSYGGGVQSNAVMVMQARGLVHFDKFVFSNVGEDSENPDTLKYIEDIAKPYMQKQGIEFVELRKTIRGEIVTLRDYIYANNRTVPLPAYLQSGAPGNRKCTLDWKILLIARYAKKNGASKTNKCIMGIGISLDEFTRMSTSRIGWQDNEYPLIDLRMTRNDCIKLIESEGLPVPPKSSCYFCPYHSYKTWVEMREKQPDLFQEAVNIEKRMNEKRKSFGKDSVYLTRFLKPLEDVIGKQMFLPEEETTCESGYCMV
jgi:hypothetical protein